MHDVPKSAKAGLEIPGLTWLIAAVGLAVIVAIPFLDRAIRQPVPTVRITCEGCGGHSFRGGVDSGRQYVECRDCGRRQFFKR